MYCVQNNLQKKYDGATIYKAKLTRSGEREGLKSSFLHNYYHKHLSRQNTVFLAGYNILSRVEIFIILGLKDQMKGKVGEIQMDPKLKVSNSSL